MDLLLYSMAEHQSVWQAALEIVRPGSVVEIGSEAAFLTATLAQWCGQNQASYTVVEPLPSDDLRDLAATHSHLRLVEGYSPDVLGEVDPADVYFVDGDHNYATVAGECGAIAAAAAASGRRPLLIMHDVGWPWARRDLYYDPYRLSEADRHPFTFESGVTLDNPGVIEGGFRGEGAFAAAVTEGGPRNGVRTAIDDFLAANPDWTFCAIPLVFGLGFLFPADAFYAAELMAMLSPFVGNPLLERLERNRLTLYLKVLSLQDELVPLYRERDDLVDDLAGAHKRIAELEADLGAAREEAHAEAIQREAEAQRRIAEHAAVADEVHRLAASRWLRLLEVVESPVRKFRPGLGTVRERVAKLGE